MSSTGKQRDNAEGHRARRSEHAEKIPAARPDNRELRRQGVGVNDGGDRVGGVVEAVHEFEAKRDQQRDAEQNEGQDCRRAAASDFNVGADRIGHVEQAKRQHREDPERKPRVHRLVDSRLDRRFGVWAESSVECGGHGGSLGLRGSSIATAHDSNVKAPTGARPAKADAPNLSA